jgi:DNA-binding NtrC family response regulator
MSTILVVDDEEDIRDALQMILERAGYEVNTASNGSEAIKLQNSDPAELVIIDIIMPETDGVNAIMKIRKTHPGVKIIAISGGGGVEPAAYKPTAIKTTAYLGAAQEAGADRIFAKPFDRADVVRAVEELIGRRMH